MKRITNILLLIFSVSITGNGQIDTSTVRNDFTRYITVGYRGNIEELLNLTYPKFIDKIGRDSIADLMKDHIKLAEKGKNETKLHKVISIGNPVTINSEYCIPINYESIGISPTAKLILNQWALAITDTSNIDWKFIVLNQVAKDLFSEFSDVKIPQETTPSLLDYYKLDFIVQRVRYEWQIDKETGDSCLNAKHYIYDKNFFKDDNYDCEQKVKFSQTIDKNNNLIESYITDRENGCYFLKYQYISNDGYADSVCTYSSCKSAIAIKYALKDYDKNEHLIKITDIEGKKFTIKYKFDNNGIVNEKIILGERIKEIYTYKNGIIQSKVKSYLNSDRLDDIWIYNEHGSIIKYQEGKYRKTVYEYDNSNNLLSESEFQLRKDSWELKDKETFKYNEQNDLIEAIYISGDRMIYHYKYEYID